MRRHPLATISKLPSLEIINGFKGVIDFYVCRGQPCARSWPRPPQWPRAPAVQSTINIFRVASALFPGISETVRQAYKEMAGSTKLTDKDMFFRGYISGTLRYFFAVDDLEES